MKDQKNKKRPLFLSLLCISAFVYAAFFAIIFLISLFNNAWLSEVLNNFLINNKVSKVSLAFILIIGLILHLAIFWGTIKIWKLKKSGIYTYLISIIVLIAYQYFIGIGNIYMTSFLILFILIIGLHFKLFKTQYNQQKVVD